ncbi:acyl-CoA N-acyltransferase [Macrolepiota fuliginosa MF-IS2]|uniref:Acyl-CoA N-acyltransferase n=1 Tax=Macrolepiota fuliginosa MF-IS2 TaxID=1400762 RepID=A0A9P5XDY2_9AGAR|nr:acyl-CoA N-acyltransferase [Macrolepiota fuliginosa MF-IS2]
MVEVTPASETVFFDYVTAAEVHDAADHERKAFPPDEADSPEQFRYRYTHAGHLFLGAFVPSPSQPKGRRLVGHICSTQSPLTYYTKESMSVHVPFSASICVHSICLLGSYRRKGIGMKMIREYLSRIRDYCSSEELVSKGKPERVLLLTHSDVRPFYEKAGFACTRKSDVVLGTGVWYEMCLDLKADSIYM